MKRYQFPIPCLTLGFAAVALTALTVGLSVIAPTTLQPGNPEVGAVARAAMPAPAAVDLGVARIEGVTVTAIRQLAPAAVLVRQSQAVRSMHKQQC